MIGGTELINTAFATMLRIHRDRPIRSKRDHIPKTASSPKAAFLHFYTVFHGPH